MPEEGVWVSSMPMDRIQGKHVRRDRATGSLGIVNTQGMSRGRGACRVAWGVTCEEGLSLRERFLDRRMKGMVKQVRSCRNDSGLQSVHRT